MKFKNFQKGGQLLPQTPAGFPMHRQLDSFSLRKLQGSLYKDPRLTFEGRQVIDTGDLHYYGNSLGGILGGVYMAVTTDVASGSLLVWL